MPPVTSPPSSNPAPSPPPPKPLCPAEVTATLTPEPRPPAGVDAARLATTLRQTFGQPGADFYEWLSVAHPVWARELAQRLTKAQAACKVTEAAP